MKQKTRLEFNGHLAAIASFNHIPSAIGEAFNVEPEIQQVFQEIKGERVDFLSKINTPLVESQKGQKIGFGVYKPIASRTDTNENERQTRYVGDMTSDQYSCEQTNFDTNIKYSQMDAWSRSGDLATHYSDYVAQQVARDILMIGWNGEQVAVNTDPIANPNLEDVNEGWLTKIKKNRPENLMGFSSDGQPSTDTWKVGEGGQYNTLDTLVFDIMLNLLDTWHQNSDDLLVIVGRELWVAHGLSLLSHSNLPTERNALQTWFANESVAGLNAIMVPFFPKRGLMVTSYDNLSVYSQAGSLRRTIIDNPKRDRVEEYLSSNDAYVVEDYGKVCGVRDGSIMIPDGNGGWK